MIKNVPIYAAAVCLGGTFAGIGSTGYGIAGASFDANTRIPGVWSKNYTGGTSSGDVSGDIERGTFEFDNSVGAGDAVTAAYNESVLYAVNNNTVSISSNGGTRPACGICEGINAVNSKVMVRVGVGSLYSQLDYTAPRYIARGAVTTNHSLSAFTVATNTDGITYVAGDIVLLTGQTSALQNGPYVVGTVATTAPLTRPSWFAAAAAIQQGLVIECGGEGTVYGGSEWKAMCGKAQVVDTNDPLFTPRIIKGSAAASSGTLTVTGLTIRTNAVGLAMDFTTPANNAALVVTLTSGASSAGSMAITNGTTTDVMKYVITNW